MTTVYWDLTSECNASCRYCSAARSRRGRVASPTSPGEAPATLDRLAQAGARRLVLLGGEPTLYAGLPGLIRRALGRGMQMGMATNGQALTARLRAELLAIEGLSINVSLDSFFAEENDATRGAGYHRRAMRHLCALLEERRRLRAAVRVTIQVTLTYINLPRLEESLLRMAALGVDGILVDRMRSFSWQSSAVRRLAPAPAGWVCGAERVARSARKLPGGPPLLLNYGNARLRAALGEAYGYPGDPGRVCPGGLQAAVLDASGWLHPCRLITERPVPRRADGRPWFRARPVRACTPAGGRFLASPYFVEFFNFAHSARVYERISLCRRCPHYEVCEPCPLDVVDHGERTVAECRHLVEHGLEG
ncbi:MAG: radical SAM protein [Candidatus Eisenbacteria sp.]|nr:radical SAM protein [Candidatus Eisenbacteria bacterium]